MRTKTEEKIEIPVEFREEITKLNQADSEAKIREKCCDSRLKKAVEAGDEEAALIEQCRNTELTEAHLKTHNALWGRMGEIFPDLDFQEVEYKFNPMKFTLEPCSGSNLLSRMLDRD